MEENFGTTKIWQNGQPTKNSSNFHHPNFYTSIESHVNIKQIYWKLFLRHVPNNLQPGYHQSPLHSCDYMNFPFLVHKVSLHLPKDYPRQIGTHGSLKSLKICTKCISCHFTLTVKLPDIVTIYTYIKYIQITLLKNLIAWGTLHTAIFQILFYQRQFSRQFTKFSKHQSFPPYSTGFIC